MSNDHQSEVSTCLDFGDETRRDDSVCKIGGILNC